MTKPKSKTKVATRSAARKISKGKSRARSIRIEVCSAIRHQARPHHRDAAGARWHNDCRHHDRNGLAAAFGAWLSCWCRPQEARSQSGFRTDRQRPDLSHQGWKGFVHHRRIAQSRRRDTMLQKRRSGRASTKTSIGDEIAHLRGLDLKGLRSRWQSVFQRPATRTPPAAFAVRNHCLSDSSRSLWRFGPRDQAGSGSDRLKRDRHGSVRTSGQLRSEADRTDAGDSVGTRVGSAFAAGDGDGRWVCLEWPNL